MKKILSLLLVVMIAVSLFGCQKSSFDASGNSLTVHFIDVGQGDSTLLESGGEFVLIDAGEREYGEKVADYIKSRGTKCLKYVIATHPHSDHVGGLQEVLSTFEVEHFITTETDQSTKTWLGVLEKVLDNGIDYIDARVGDTYSFGESEFTILAPSSDSYDGYNNYSVVTRVVCGDVSFLLAGDAEKESEREMLRSGLTLDTDVLKCGHHGSSTSSTAEFLETVTPAYAVISCGVDNEYGHPHKETLSKLELMGVQYYRTDVLGTVVAYTDGRGIAFTTESEGYAMSTIPATVAERTVASLEYIGNRSSKVFHYPNCSGVKKMSEKNRVVLNSRDDAISAGYKPCSLCNP